MYSTTLECLSPCVGQEDILGHDHFTNSQGNAIVGRRFWPRGELHTVIFHLLIELGVDSGNHT